MSQFTKIGVVGEECPYCGKTLPKRPTRKSKCKFCGQPIFVRTRPIDESSVLLREDQLPILEEQWALDYKIKEKMRGVSGQWARDGVTSLAQATQQAFATARRYMEANARDYMKISYIRFLRVRFSSKHQELDACDFYADADMWGLGPGVYPKAEAPVPPFHEGCLCGLSAKLGLPDKTPVRRQTEAAALQAGFTPAVAAQVQAQINSGQVTIKKVKDC